MCAASPQENAPGALVINHAAVKAKPAAPLQIPEARGDGRTLAVDLLQFVQRRRRVLAGLAQGIAGNQAESFVAHREHAHKAVFRREDMKVAVGEVAVDVQVTQA